MTNETKSVVQNAVDDLAMVVVRSVYLGLIETKSPNDPEFWDEHDRLAQEAQAYAIELLQLEWEE